MGLESFGYRNLMGGPRAIAFLTFGKPIFWRVHGWRVAIFLSGLILLLSSNGSTQDRG